VCITHPCRNYGVTSRSTVAVRMIVHGFPSNSISRFSVTSASTCNIFSFFHPQEQKSTPL
jgi:hypothetical protein